MVEGGHGLRIGIGEGAAITIFFRATALVVVNDAGEIIRIPAV
jgi:hypothetical protein